MPSLLRHSGSSSVIDAAAFSSQSTAPTSVSSGSPRIPGSRSKFVPVPAGRPSQYDESARPWTAQRSTFQPSHQAYKDDLSPSTLCYARSSVDTYVSESESDEDDDDAIDDIFDITDDDDEGSDTHKHYPHSTSRKASLDDNAIPPLPEYNPDICGGISSMRYSTTPQEFAKLFPSLNRMSIRHDETTTDGNMNLRVDIAVPVGERRRLTSYQLFHLRMYDLTKREFSLRRYGRDSGREVCSSKLNFIDPADKDKTKKSKSKMAIISRKSDADTSAAKHWGRRSSSASSSHSGSGHSVKTAPSIDLRPTLQRSMTTALRSLSAMASARPSFRRAHASTSPHQCRPATSHSLYTPASAVTSPTSSSHPSLSSSAPSYFVRPSPPPPPAPKPTNTVKLEFSNYARVDLERSGAAPAGHAHGSDNYAFEWWGHQYAWKRSSDKLLNTVSYHLMRDDNGDTPVAHIVPETRSPNQVDADEDAGGWIPPCHMWISDPAVLSAMTDVGDVIVATGLLTLADDCIRMRWPSKTSAAGSSGHGFAFGMEHVGPRALMQHVFHRRGSSGSSHAAQASSHMSSPLRRAAPVH